MNGTISIRIGSTDENGGISSYSDTNARAIRLASCSVATKV